MKIYRQVWCYDPSTATIESENSVDVCLRVLSNRHRIILSQSGCRFGIERWCKIRIFSTWYLFLYLISSVLITVMIVISTFVCHLFRWNMKYNDRRKFVSSAYQDSVVCAISLSGHQCLLCFWSYIFILSYGLHLHFLQSGLSALQLAVSSGCVNVIYALLDRRADIETRDMVTSMHDLVEIWFAHLIL